MNDISKSRKDWKCNMTLTYSFFLLVFLSTHGHQNAFHICIWNFFKLCLQSAMAAPPISFTTLNYCSNFANLPTKPPCRNGQKPARYLRDGANCSALFLYLWHGKENIVLKLRIFFVIVMMNNTLTDLIGSQLDVNKQSQ